ncbi:hypothetical protein LZS85_15640 [Aliivibrio fischeri]|uniref:hypothetical protein n=1 Tax=Aliivibrio fischeri TaxID=668 RepID=UPI001F2ABA9A|nr:hypothetical protein [Aliivibrio fischeri]MCE7567556.1 hypothetical protein [Aliivibrio fischeri]
MGALKLREGDTFESKKCGKFTVVHYTSFKKVLIRFENTGKHRYVTTESIYSGRVKDLYSPVVCGVGFLGSGKYKAGTSSYYRWIGILRRCYDSSCSDYKEEKEVSKWWHDYQRFAKWYYLECSFNGIEPDNNTHIVSLNEGANIYSGSNCYLTLNRTSNLKVWKFIAPDGSDITVKGLLGYCKDNNLSYYNMRRLGLKEIEEHNGYKSR